MDKHLAKLIDKVKNPYVAIAIATGVILVLLLASGAKAQPGQDPDFVPPGHRGAVTHNGGTHEQSQQQGQISVNQNSAVSSSRSSSDSRASSYSGGNSVGVYNGGSRSGAQASGGSADASGGNSSVSYSESNDYTASSAASVWIGYCQTGGSGQSGNGGFSVVNSDQFCDHVRAAEAMLNAYNLEVAGCKCVGVCTDKEASVELQCQDSEQAQYYLAAYHENLHDANELVQNTQATGFIGRIAGQLAIPTAMLALIFFL